MSTKTCRNHSKQTFNELLKIWNLLKSKYARLWFKAKVAHVHIPFAKYSTTLKSRVVVVVARRIGNFDTFKRYDIYSHIVLLKRFSQAFSFVQHLPCCHMTTNKRTKRQQKCDSKRWMQSGYICVFFFVVLITVYSCKNQWNCKQPLLWQGDAHDHVFHRLLIIWEGYEHSHTGVRLLAVDCYYVFHGVFAKYKREKKYHLSAWMPIGAEGMPSGFLCRPTHLSKHDPLAPSSVSHLDFELWLSRWFFLPYCFKSFKFIWAGVVRDVVRSICCIAVLWLILRLWFFALFET